MNELVVELHRKALVVDGHADTLWAVQQQRRGLLERAREGHSDVPRLMEGGVDLQVFALFPDPDTRAVDQLLPYVLQMLDLFWQAVSASSALVPILSRADLQRVGNGQLSGLLSLEGGEALRGNLSVLRMLHRLGVRAMGLTWNHRNELADGVGEEPGAAGLTRFGRQVVAEMNQLGMVVDVSHLSEKGFWDVLSVSQQPPIASHSNAKRLCGHRRNLTDEQIKALAQAGGVMGINFYPPFLSDSEPATIESVVAHMEYVAELVGVEHVGIGSDYDGISKTPVGLEDVTRLSALTEALVTRGWSHRDIHGVLGGNFLRVLATVLPLA